MDYLRYGRQMIVSDVGKEGQENINRGKVIIVGAGGLGCPVALYLATSGIGFLRIVDSDIVEISNLHRQVLHSELSVGIPKVESVKSQLLQRNSSIQVDSRNCRVDTSNVFELIEDCDVIVDCSDNSQTRYLLNDAALLMNKVLVSGSAIETCGQISVYNYKYNNITGPCYRCIFPFPAKKAQSCSDNGVLGPITGTIGNLQAMEVLKVLMKKSSNEVLCGRLLMIDLMCGSFQSIKFSKKSSCIACGSNPKISLEHPFDFIPESQSCESNIPPSDIKHIDCTEYSKLLNQKHILLDVRNKTQYSICSLPNSMNIPLSDIDSVDTSIFNDNIVYVICRRGIDSIIATKLLKEKGLENVININGGYQSWSLKVDSEFPIY